MDVRQNLKPVKKVTDIYNSQAKSSSRNVPSSSSSFLVPVSQRTSKFAKYFSPPPSFTSGGTASSSALRSPTTLAISNAIGPSVQNRVIPKSERPWRQRLADNARIRNSHVDGLSTPMDDSTTRLMAARASRRTSGGSSTSGGHSPAKDTPEQQLHHQLAALRNIVTEDKNKVRTADGALVTPRGVSTFSSALGSMPSSSSTLRFRSSAMTSSAYHPSLTVSTNTSSPYVMSKSYSPIRSSNSLLSSADSTASTALFHYDQSREKRQDISPRISTQNALAKAPLAVSESINDVRLDKQPTPEEGEQKVGERRRRSGSIRRQKSGLVGAARTQSRNSSSETEEKQRPRPPRKSSKETKKGVDESKEAKSSEKSSANPTTDLAAEKSSTKMVAADVSTPKPTLLTRTLSGEGKKLEEKVVTPLAKRKKKVVEGEAVKKQAEPVVIPSPPSKETVESAAPAAKPVDEEDESKYNAVAKFKPASSVAKPVAGRAKKPVAVVAVEAPVPGSWIASETERYISQNKHLIRKPSETKIEVVCKELQLERPPPKSIRTLPTVKRKVLLSKHQQLNSSLTNHKSQGEQKQSAAIVLKPKIQPKALKIIKNIAKPKKLATALAIVNKEFSSKKRLRLGIEKIMRIRGLKMDRQHLKCHQPTSVGTALILTILFREQQRAASVTILSPAIPDVNWARIDTHLQITPAVAALPKKIKEKAVPVVKSSIPNKENVGIQPVVAGLAKKIAAAGPPLIVSSSQRPLSKRVEGKGPAFIKNTHIPCSTTYTAGGPIVLPDQSLLEEYVQRKRNELENLHTSDEFLSTESSRRDSPNLFFPAETASNLVHPQAKEPSKPLAMPNNAKAPVEASPQMVQISSYAAASKAPTTARSSGPALVNNNQATAPNFMLQRQLKKPQELAKPAVVFDTPKSLFEERMQNQANQLRKTIQATSFPVYDTTQDQTAPETTVDSATMAGLRRRSSTEKHSVAHNFSLAMDQLQKQHSAERYAAHIPLSGRQSTTSVDSNNSGALDTASRQLDQMIDQARYRHHQHARSKFKEAIDYLDHIFEDLRNECDKDGFSYKDNEKIEAKPQVIAPVKPTGNRIQAAKAAFQKQQGGNEESANRTSLQKPNVEAKWPKSATAAANENKPVNKGLGKPSGIRTRQAPQQQGQQLKQRVSPQKAGQRKSFTNNNDVDVAETIVLPSKNTSDRLDFTRKWLVDDIKSWADHPNTKPDLVNPGEQAQLEETNDSDEHSLGSCSAEVAAINASEKQKKKVKESEVVKPAAKTQPAKQKAAATVKAIPQPKMVNTAEQVPIRPQPYRPQPQFAIYPPNGNVNDSIYELQKVASHEQLRMRFSQERAASQDYHSLGSTHSQEGLKPSSSGFLSTNSLHRGGAFVNYPQRGSIQSLPDAALLTVNQPAAAMRLGRVAANDHAGDHALAIDLLVAELELNTDAPSVPDKRRSFPTTQGEVAVGSARRDAGSNQQANKPGLAKISVQRSSNSPVKMPQMGQSSTLGRGASLQQDRKSQQNSLDEVAEMLRDVAGDLKFQADLIPKTSLSTRQQQPQQQPASRKYSNPRANLGMAAAGEKSAANPFETINQERLNPSRVEAIQHMFEKSGNSNGVSSWSKKLAKNTTKDTPVYVDTVEYAPAPEKPKLRTVNIAPIFRQQPTSPSIANSSEPTGPVKFRPKPVEKMVPFSSAQPPLVPPVSLGNKPESSSGNKPVATSSSGYYSTGGVGTTAALPHPHHNPSAAPASSGSRRSGGESVFAGKNNNSTSSRAPSMDVDDDGFYDNILTENSRLSGVLSEMDDDTSLCSQNLSHRQKSGSRIGQLIRRIGGNNSLSKPPVQSAASLVSLNKVSNDTLIHPRPHPGLIKSNSLSNEPWRIHAMGREAQEAVDSKGMGIGNRLKQTIFGASKKRLQT